MREPSPEGSSSQAPWEQIWLVARINAFFGTISLSALLRHCSHSNLIFLPTLQHTWNFPDLGSGLMQILSGTFSPPLVLTRCMGHLLREAFLDHTISKGCLLIILYLETVFSPLSVPYLPHLQIRTMMVVAILYLLSFSTFL